MAILYCGCANPYMDKKYGKGRRVMNRAAKIEGHRCASCGKEYRGGGEFSVKQKQPEKTK